jgi:hypothetical protein
LAFLAISCLFLAAPASAGVLYDNGPINGGIIAWTINEGFAVTDSFELATNSTVTGVNFGAWAFGGDTPLSVDWIISTSNAFDGSTSVGSGTASLTNAFQVTNGYGYNVYQSNFSVGSRQLNAGTYWLQLQNAVTTNAYPLYWDENDGLSLAYENTIGQLGSGSDPPGGSESFQILGAVGTATPEPSSLALFGSGILLMAGVLRRKLSR